MLMDTHLARNLHAAISGPRAASPPWPGPSTGGSGFVTVRPEEPDWVALMVRVRDARDRAAFADLFRHFAPRIKGFLMKSGASAALAEECAQDVMATVWQ